MRARTTRHVAGVHPAALLVHRARQLARRTHRTLFCYSLALSRRPAARPSRTPLAERVVRALPFGRTLRQVVRHRPGTRRVPVAALLMGGQAGADASAFAVAVGTLRYGSTPMEQSPHVALLEAARAADGDVADDALRASEYWTFAHEVSTVSGDFFGATDDAALLAVTRNFVEWALGRSPRMTTASGSPVEDRVLVARIAGGPLYQVVDGHHRVAASIASGEATVRVHRTWLRTGTPLQERLQDHSEPGIRGRLLVQPVPSRELGEGWAVTRNCPDRLMRMVRFLEESPAEPTTTSFLDVGARYGWFLKEMRRLGWQVHGVEDDDELVGIGTSFYGLHLDDVAVGPWADGLRALEAKFDAVACFDLAVALSADRDGATGLLAALDRVTRGVLFVDGPVGPGQSGDGDGRLERDALVRTVLERTSFTEVADLGENGDPLGPWSDSYGSRLLAFTR